MSIDARKDNAATWQSVAAAIVLLDEFKRRVPVASAQDDEIDEVVARLREMRDSYNFVACTHCGDKVHLNEPDTFTFQRDAQTFQVATPTGVKQPSLEDISTILYGVETAGRTRILDGSILAPGVYTVKVVSSDDNGIVVDWVQAEADAKGYSKEDFSSIDYRMWVSGRGPKQEKNYHTDIGFPADFSIEKYLRNLPTHLAGSVHYEEQRFERGLPHLVELEWVKQGTLITITRIDGALARYSVRGPWNEGHDLTVAIDAATGELITGWFNRKNDWHRLTKSEYNNPEED